MSTQSQSQFPAPTDRALRVRDVAAMLACSVPTVWRRARAGLLPAKKNGCITFWLLSDVERFLRGEALGK